MLDPELLELLLLLEELELFDFFTFFLASSLSTFFGLDFDFDFELELEDPELARFFPDSFFFSFGMSSVLPYPLFQCLLMMGH